MHCKLMLLAVSALVITGGCTPVDAGFGEAQRYNMAAQTIDPDPVYAEGSAQPGYHGEKAQKATDRYRKGTTKPVRTESTSSVSGSGSGN